MTKNKQFNNKAVKSSEETNVMPLENVQGLVGTLVQTEAPDNLQDLIKVEDQAPQEPTSEGTQNEPKNEGEQQQDQAPQEQAQPSVVTQPEKPVKFAPGTKHTDANGELTILKRYTEENITWLEYAYANKPETVIKNKEVNLHSNIYKFAQRVKNGQVGRRGSAEAMEALKSENEDLKKQIEELHMALEEAKEEANKYKDLYEKKNK